MSKLFQFHVLLVIGLSQVASKRPPTATGGSHYHAGHLATHITRLNRYEAGNVQSMLEAESQWLGRNARGRGGVQSLLEVEEGDAANDFVRLSPGQLDALQQHHADTRATQVSYGLRSAADRANTSSLLEGQTVRSTIRSHVSKEIVWPFNWFSTAAIQSDSKEEDDSKVQAFDVLSQLGSQYVGPIGVGTNKLPAVCGSASLAESAQNDNASENHATNMCSESAESLMFVVFDTGSTNLWVTSDLCKEGPCVKKGRHRYDHARSQSYEEPADGKKIGITFGTGGLDGRQAVEDFRIGGLKIKKQTFGMIESLRGQVFEDCPLEGILGLAFPAMSANGVRPFFDTVIQEKALKHNEFSFYLSRTDPSGNAVLWGGVDPNLFTGKIEYFPVVDPYYWSLGLHNFKIGDDVYFGEGADGAKPGSLTNTTNNIVNHAKRGVARFTEWLGGSLVQVDGLDVSSAVQTNSDEDNLWETNPESSSSNLLENSAKTWHNQYAIVDSGTTFFSADGEAFDKIIHRLAAKRCGDITTKSHPDITFNLPVSSGETRPFVFDHYQYMAASNSADQKSEDSMCHPSFMKLHIPEAHGPAMVLGEVFLKNYFSTFDRGDGSDSAARIGFAPSAQSEKAKGHLHTATKSQPSFLTERGARESP